MSRTSVWSPLGNQPRCLYTIEGADADVDRLIQLEYTVPGTMVYGHHEGDRGWYRLERCLADGPFDYYRVHAHGTAAYLVDARLNMPNSRLEVGMDLIGELTSGDETQLHEQTDWGESLVKRLWITGRVKEEAFRALASYQARAVYYAWSGAPGLKLVMPCGSGKTLAAILMALVLDGTTLVVCPARARRGWEDQVKRWTNVTAQRLLPGVSDIDPDASFYIVGLELLNDYLGFIKNRIRPTLVIFDEIHRFANHQRWDVIINADGELGFLPKQTKGGNKRAVRGYAAMAVSQLDTVRVRVGLTASPMGSGHRSALWAEDDLLLPRSLGQHRKFTMRYCSARDGEYGFEHKGHDSKTPEHVIQELRDRQSQYVMEVTHTESHGQLPATRIDVVYLEESQLTKTPWPGYNVRGAKTRWKRERTPEAGEALLLAQTARDSSRKRGWITQKVLEGLENGGKVVLLTFLRSDADRWADHMGSAIRQRGLDTFLQWGHGGTPIHEREEMAPAFAAHPGSALLVGTGGAFGESVDGLQAANLAIIAQLPWTPMDVDQWRGRFDRLGGRATLVLIPIAEGTYDETLVCALAPKFGGVQKMFRVEQYEGLAEKLKGLDTEERRNELRQAAIKALFG